MESEGSYFGKLDERAREAAEKSGPVGRWPEKRQVMYDKARFTFSTDILPRLQEVADRLGVPPYSLVSEAYQKSAPIDLTDLISSHLDSLEQPNQPAPSED